MSARRVGCYVLGACYRLFPVSVLIAASLTCLSVAGCWITERSLSSADQTGPRATEISDVDSRPSVSQLEWFLNTLSDADAPNFARWQQRFAPSFLKERGAELPSFFQELRRELPRARLVEVVTRTPTLIVATVQSRDPQRLGLVELGTGLFDARIRMLSVRLLSHGGLPIADVDKRRTAPETIAALSRHASGVSALVAGPGADGDCRPILAMQEEAPRAIGSVYKIWLLGAALDRIAQEPEHGQMLSLRVRSAATTPGSGIEAEAAGRRASVDDLLVLMMGRSDNTAAELVFDWLGRASVEAQLGKLKYGRKRDIVPFLSPQEQLHFYWTLTLAEVESYLSRDDASQRRMVETQVAELGPIRDLSKVNDEILVSGTWQASAMDICRALFGLSTRRYGPRISALRDEALGASVGVLGLHHRWDRIWFKGGSLVSTKSGTHVYALAWYLESRGTPPRVVIVIANDDGGGIEEHRILSLAARLIELQT